MEIAFSHNSDLWSNPIANRSEDDGSGTWQIICDNVTDENEPDHYPAFEYVNGLTEGGGGWYLPAKNEIIAFFDNESVKTAINDKLTILSQKNMISLTKISNNRLWSSTIYLVHYSDGDYDRAWWRYQSGEVQSMASYGNVRAIKAF